QSHQSDSHPCPLIVGVVLPRAKTTPEPLRFPTIITRAIIKGRRPWIPGGETMAFFNGGSRALVEILTRFQSAERPMPVDHTFFEFGSVRYHVQASASDPENVYLSISTPSLSHEASPSTGLPEFTLQEATKMYHKFAEVVEPSKEGYALTLKLNFSGLARPKDRARAVRQVSLLQSVILGSQLKHLLGSLGSSGATKLVYNHRDPFFVSRTPGKISAIFPMRFRDDTDLAVATSFFQVGARPTPSLSSRFSTHLRVQVGAVPDTVYLDLSWVYGCRSCRTPGARTRGRPGAAGRPSRRRSCAGSPCTTSPPTAASSPSTSLSGT
uniref:Arp2/3 complex 34 kDa subunit n=1 Tax=Aegilops tauschii subsp. strangulata TaxID=200361 RepID=A0A453CIP1_AEGTS